MLFMNVAIFTKPACTVFLHVHVYEVDDLYQSSYCVSSHLSVVVVLDLSKPEELWTTLEVFIKQVYGCRLILHTFGSIYA